MVTFAALILETWRPSAAGTCPGSFAPGSRFLFQSVKTKSDFWMSEGGFPCSKNLICSSFVSCDALFYLVSPPGQPGSDKLLRFPDIHGDRVAFTHGGDIWTAPVGGGSAIRLTAHPALKSLPSSAPRQMDRHPDNTMVMNIYVIPATGECRGN
jgi:hypothetical protein